MADWQITTAGATFEFDTTDAVHNSVLAIDSTHAVIFYNGSPLNGTGQAQATATVLEINSSTFAITTTQTLTFDTTPNSSTYESGLWNDAVWIDANHIINFYKDDARKGYAQVFEVNTSTYTISTASARVSLSHFLTDDNLGFN